MTWTDSQRAALQMLKEPRSISFKFTDLIPVIGVLSAVVASYISLRAIDSDLMAADKVQSARIAMLEIQVAQQSNVLKATYEQVVQLRADFLAAQKVSK